LKNPHLAPNRPVYSSQAVGAATLTPSIALSSGSHDATVDGLCKLLQRRFDENQIVEVRAAFDLAEQAHTGQSRVSGEPYISHPLAVARIVFELNMDHRSIMAALLHDVVEDTSVSVEQIETDFGEDVALLVDGMSKLTHLKFKSRAEAQAANFQKMLLAMVDDIRVVLIKLADRIHNMRTLGFGSVCAYCQSPWYLSYKE